jgi:phosphotriesterase-related protein
MKRKALVALASLVVITLLAGCGGVSQDEFDKAVADKDAALAQTATLQSQLTTTQSSLSAANAAKDKALADLAAATAVVVPPVMPLAKKGSEVNTVLGPVSIDKLGFTLVHEHISFQYGGMEADSTMYPYDRAAVKTTALKILKDLKAAGVSTLVDCTPNDCTGRDPALFAELAKETGVNIIVATGLYWEGDGSAAYWKNRSAYGYDISDEIYQMMKTEITVGIGKTGIKAGVIKVGTNTTMSTYEKAVLKAAAKAQAELGVPIMTHTQGATGGVEQADWLIANGANTTQIAIGHMNNSTDINYYLEILKRPDLYVSFDRTGLGAQATEETIAKNIAELIKKGYVNRILLSTDSVWTWDGRPFQYPAAYASYFANWNSKYIATGFRDLLKANGVTDAQITTMTVENPIRLYEGGVGAAPPPVAFSGTKYTNTEWGFSFQYPKDWAENTGTLTTGLIKQFGRSSSYYVPCAWYGVFDGATMSDAFDAFLAGAKYTRKTFNATSVTIGSQACTKAEVSYSGAYGDLDGIMVGFNKNGKWVIIACTELPGIGGAWDYANEKTDVINSITIP